MARSITAENAIFGINERIGIWNSKITPMARVDYDGQNGITPDLRTLNAMTPYVKQNALCFVLEVPRGLSYIPGGERIGIALKTMLETQTESFDGLDATVSVEYQQMIVGRNEQLDVPVKVSRERSEPSHTLTERYGLVYTRLLETWIQMLIADPVTGIPGVVSLRGAAERFSKLGEGYNAYTIIPENTSITALYIEPDPTCSYPVKAFLCTNMMPDRAGDMTAGMSKQDGGSTTPITIKFTCTQEVGPGVMNLAAEVLSRLNKVGLSSNNRRAYIGSTYDTAASSFIRTKKVNYGKAVGEQEVGILGQAKHIADSERIDHNKIPANGRTVDVPNTTAGAAQNGTRNPNFRI